MNREELRNGDNDPKLKFIPDGNNIDKSQIKIEGRDEFTGLTKEELMEYANDPFWVRLRWFLFALFWIIWIAMLVVAIILIIKAPRCTTSKGAETWAKESPLYQVYPRSFKDSNGDGIGDFNGLSSKLDYLSKLGVKNIILNSPLNSNPFLQDEALVNFTKVNPEYGTNAEFKNLIEEIHKKGMKVIMEIDIHHTSNFHPWFNKSINRSPRHSDFYIWQDGSTAPPTLNRSLWAGSAWTYAPPRNQYYFSHFAPNLPNLNLNNEVVKSEIKDIIEFWLKYGIDGVLIPNADLLFTSPMKNSSEQMKTTEFIAYLKNSMDKIGKNKLLIVQPYNDDNAMLLGSKADLVVNKNLLKMRDNCDAKCVATLLKSPTTKSSAQQAWMLGNKDTSRIASRMGNNQYTNALNALLLLLPGGSLPYYGDEIAMVDNPQALVPQTYDPLCKLPFKGECRDLYRSPMQWNSIGNAGFSSDPNKLWTPVNQNAATNNVESLQLADKYLPVFNRLVDLKSKIGNGDDFTMLPLQNPSVLAFLRKSGTTHYLVLINFGKEVSTIVPKNLLGTNTLIPNDAAGHILLDTQNPLTFSSSVKGNLPADKKPGQDLTQSLTLTPGQVVIMDLKK